MTPLAKILTIAGLAISLWTIIIAVVMEFV